MGEYFDISPLVSERIAVFPGDQPFHRQVAMSFASGDNLELSAIQTTVHLGAHTDAPSHYATGGKDMASRDLSYYMGTCQVVRVQLARGQRIVPKDLLDRNILAPRVLFATSSFPDPNHWNNDFNSLSPELIEFLAQKKVRLVGIDTPSIDPASEKVLSSHHAVARHDMAILEGVVLDEVPEGLYSLVALPLKLSGLDASPVRAILLKNHALFE